MAHIHIAATLGVTIEGFRAVAAKHNPPQDRWSAEQLFPAFQALGMTDVAPNMDVTEYDADELYIR
jgi:hypothetical protein